jgi:hypothetical protein
MKPIADITLCSTGSATMPAHTFWLRRHAFSNFKQATVSKHQTNVPNLV